MKKIIILLCLLLFCIPVLSKAGSGKKITTSPKPLGYIKSKSKGLYFSPSPIPVISTSPDFEQLKDLL